MRARARVRASKRCARKKIEAGGRPNCLVEQDTPPIYALPIYAPTRTMDSAQMPTPKPTLAVPEELGKKDWVYMTGFWFIEGEACNRRKNESDKAYLARVRKNKAIRDRRLARERARWDAEDAARAAEPAPVPAVAPAPAEDWQQMALYWQNRCKAMEERFKNVIAAVGHLHRITAAEVDQAILEQPE